MRYKRIIAFVFAVVIAAFSSTNVFALNTTVSPDDTVGKISICSDLTSTHIWIYILNTSDETLRVGLYDLPSGEGLSLGSFGFTCKDGAGTYYNLEAHRNGSLTNDNCIAITEELSRSELESVTAKLISFNHWDLIVNCSFFACAVWNAGSDITIIPCTIPFVCRAQILSRSGLSSMCDMPYASDEKVFRQIGKGDGAYLSPASRGTLDVK